MPSPRCTVLNQPAQLSAVITRLQNTGHAFSLPLYRAALAGELGLVLVAPGGRVPARLLDHRRPPTVVVVCGDPEVAAPTPPPDAFPQARRLLAWTASAMLHATGGREEHYRGAVEAVRVIRRVLLIETATAQENAWLALLHQEVDRREVAGRTLPVLVLSARLQGGVHPIQGAPAGTVMQ